MSAFPIRANGAEPFTPECLLDLPNPPVFMLRHASWEDKVTLAAEYARLGLSNHGHEAMRAAYLDGLANLYEAESADHGAARLKAYWAAIDDMETKIKELQSRRKDAADDEAKVSEIDAQIDGLELEFDTQEAGSLDALVDEIGRNWPPIGNMRADNVRFSAYSGRVIVAILCSGWTGLSTPFKKKGAVLDFEALNAAAEELAAMEAKAGISEGIAMLQLQVAAMRKTRLDKEEEKNSPSLPSQSSTQDSLSPTGETTAPTSPESDTSKTSAASE